MMKKLFTSISLIAFILSSLQYGFSQPIFITQEYAGLIIQKVTSCLVYPTEAMQRGWEGIVKVRFILAPDGRVKDVDIAESSGYPLLDAAAILAVKDASPYPFPTNFSREKEKELEIVLPVNYSRTFQEPASDFSPEQYFKPKTLEAIAPDTTVPRFEEQSQEEQPQTPNQAQELQAPAARRAAPALSSGEIIMPRDKELTGFIEIALKNYQPAQVAKQEVELAELKMLESKRNLLPNAKVTAYDSLGKTFGEKYEEREVKLTIDHPLYYGGRLQDALKQAQVNLEITKKNYDRTRVDVIQKTETAYYYLLGGRMHYKTKQSLLKEAQQLLDIIQKLTAQGLLIPLEGVTSKAWVDKIQFQINSLQQDNYMSELTFKQVLNVKENPVVKGEILEVRRLDLDFDRCLELALNNRPEMYLSQLMVKFNEYGKKIELEKNKFTVDATAGAGLYQGGYESERMKSSSTWNVGLKATKPLGANTLNSAATSERVQKRLGQTQDTKSSTLSGEFGIMDNMKRISDAKKSDIDLSRALSDFNETSKTITFEVQDAFLNYQKAVLQMNEADAEINFRRCEFDVTKARAMAGETTISPAMESLYNLAEAQTAYFQALTNYYISLANLKKATGYSLDLNI